MLALFYFSFGGLPNLYGQTIQKDTFYNIPTINIIASKIRQHNTGSINQQWTSEQLDKIAAKHVGELLGEEAGIYLKSYGQGSLATSSVRGGSAGHTLVLWNGLPIHSPMLGLLDLALLPIQQFESVNFTAGGNSSMWGSGAIGGVLNMGNQPDFSSKLKITNSTRLGSFGQFQQNLKFRYGNEKLQFASKVSHQQAKNDFHYFLADGLPDRQQTNAELNQQHFGQDVFWNINNRNKLALHLWWQKSDRQIPPTNVQTRSEAHQDDVSTRAIFSYQRIEKNGLWNFKTGFFNEDLDFFDDQTLLESLSNFKTYLAEITRTWSWRKNHEFLIGNTYTHTQVWTADYVNNHPSEFKKAIFGSWKYQGKKLNTQLSLRQEMIDQSIVPIIPAFGFDYNITSTFLMKGKFSRNYRLPTFNDRFWLPGGNIDLAPESGWSQELSLVYKHDWKNFSINTSFTAFNRNIDNWILWSRQEGQTFWSANNITKVWSRGLEPRIQFIYKNGFTTFQLRSGYNFIRSTNQVALSRPNMEVGEQLIYTPIHHVNINFTIQRKNLSLAYHHSFTGATDGINDDIAASQLGNFRIQYDAVFKSYKGNLFCNINNIWDVNYQVVERRPMPGIHFETGISLIFNKK